MKRFLQLLLFAVLLAPIQACKKTEYIVPNKTIVMNIGPGSWIPINGGRSFTAALDVPELDDYMNEAGGILVYLSFGSRTYEQIPQVYNGESYIYLTRPGQAVLEVHRADGVGFVGQPVGVTVKIVLIDSDY